MVAEYTITTETMRLLKYAARKSLLFFGYPKLETSHPEMGVYDVGAVRARMSPDVPACQFFYPAAAATAAAATEQPGPYFRPAAVEGLMKFLGYGDGLMQLLSETTHPLADTYGADPLLTTTKQKFPLVLFSHGLSGTMEMYTEICAQIASTGCVVVAVEHEDGTASYAETPDGTPIPYHRPPSDVPYSRKTAVNFRMPKLEQRVGELHRIFDRFVAEGAAATETDTDEETEGDEERALVRKIVAATDPSKLHLVGHSFGGATQLLAAQTWMASAASASAASAAKSSPATVAERPTANPSSSNGAATAAVVEATTATIAELPSKPSPVPVPRSVTVFDAWNFAMSEEAVAAGLGGGVGGGGGGGSSKPLGVLSVLSEEWAATNPEREQTQEFLRNCRGNTNVAVRSRVAPNSVHQSMSDTEAFLPTSIATRIGNRGTGETRHQTIRALVREIARFAASETGDDDHGGDDDETESILVDYPL